MYEEQRPFPDLPDSAPDRLISCLSTTIVKKRVISDRLIYYMSDRLIYYMLAVQKGMPNEVIWPN